MSIIVDALERVQSDRHMGQPQYNKGAFEIHEDSIEKDDTPPMEQPSKSYTKLIIMFLAIVFVINIFYMLQNPDRDDPDFLNNLENAETIAEVATINETEELLNAAPINIEARDTEVKDTETNNVDILDPIDDAFLSDFDIEEVLDPPEIIEAPQQPQATPVIQENQKITPPSLDWLSSGIIKFKKEGLNQAITLWHDGFSLLDKNTPVISIMINRIPSLAEKTLKKLHRRNVYAFSVIGRFKNQPAYFTLALDEKKVDVNLKKKIASIIGNEPFYSTQEYIKKHMDQINEPMTKTHFNPLDTIQSKPITFLPFKKISNEKRLFMAKEAVINGNYRDAILKLRPVLFNSKPNWEVLFWIGSAKLGLGLYKEADDYFKNALALNANMPQLWTQRAIIAQEKDDHIAALKHLHRAKTISPSAPEVILNIAYSNDALGDRKSAVLSYREFLSLTRGNSLYAQQRQAVDFRLTELGF